MIRDVSFWRLMQTDVNSSDYALLDFGHGRKLERLGPIVLDRCSPAAEGLEKQEPGQWRSADLRLDDRGQILAGKLPQLPWQIEVAGLRFGLELTPFGHIGIFPEQHVNWHQLRNLSTKRQHDNLPQGLNLFAYTGGSTMALAKAGFQVVHVDASAPAVRWARENAELNQLHNAPIRWIVEDARKFAARELKRERRYDVIVLDPPSFGHGPGGTRWEIEQHLFPLLDACLQLLSGPHAMLMLTGHSVTPTVPELVAWLSQQTEQQGTIVAQRLSLCDTRGRQLDCGYCVRWQAGENC